MTNMTRDHIKSPYVRKMMAEELLAIRKLNIKFHPDPLVIHWMMVEADSIYHRIDMRIRSGELSIALDTKQGEW